MNLKQIIKNFLIAGFGTPVLVFLLHYFFGWYGQQTFVDYCVIGLAAGIGGGLGEFLRQKSK